MRIGVCAFVATQQQQQNGMVFVSIHNMIRLMPLSKSSKCIMEKLK